MHTVSAVAYDSPENLVVEMTIVKLRHAEQFVGKELSGVAFSRNKQRQTRRGDVDACAGIIISIIKKELQKLCQTQ